MARAGGVGRPAAFRVAPGLLLLVLAPVVGEFLVGDLSVRSIGLLLYLIPQYGGGALLIREIARRTGRGWPAIVLLALAYALIEEGFTTQTLFNPTYSGHRLLDYGYIPALGTSLNWCVFVLTIHVVWSISTPILIAEGLAAERRTTPWLGGIGLAAAAVLFVLGCVLTTVGTLAMTHFVASIPQFTVVAIPTIAAVAVALLLVRPRGQSAGGGTAPSPLLVGLAALVLATAFWLVEYLAQQLGLPAAVAVLVMLVCIALAAVLLTIWSRAAGWGPYHHLAIATGTVLTYGWVGLRVFLAGSTNLGVRTGLLDDAGQVLEILVVLGLVAWAVAGTRRARAEPAA